MTKRPNVYIRTFSNGLGAPGWEDIPGWDGEAEAYVFLGFKPLNEMFITLSQADPDCDFFPRTNRSSDRFKKWDIVGAGVLFRDNTLYYPCSTRVRACHRNKGYGALLYKALILAAIKCAKEDKLKNWTFGPHFLASGETSQSAMRVYTSLTRKGYLKTTDRPHHYLPGKTPKNFKPIFY